jgi:hypothetical protein
MFNELDTIVLSRDIEEYNLARGDVGAIVHCHAGNKAYEVEFITGEGKTIAVVTLTNRDIRPMERQEILHVRSYAVA